MTGAVITNRFHLSHNPNLPNIIFCKFYFLHCCCVRSGPPSMLVFLSFLLKQTAYQPPGHSSPAYFILHTSHTSMTLALSQKKGQEFTIAYRTSPDPLTFQSLHTLAPKDLFKTSFPPFPLRHPAIQLCTNTTLSQLPFSHMYYTHALA